MYQEWMDGVPLLFKGAYYNNINELKRAISYYEKQGDYSTAKTYKEMLTEQRKLQAEEEKYERCHPIKSKFKSIVEDIADIF